MCSRPPTLYSTTPNKVVPWNGIPDVVNYSKFSKKLVQTFLPHDASKTGNLHFSSNNAITCDRLQAKYSSGNTMCGMLGLLCSMQQINGTLNIYTW